MIRRFLAKAILFTIAIPHVAALCVALWLDEPATRIYLDALVKARRQLDR